VASHLSLAGSSRGTVGLGTSGGGTVGLLDGSGLDQVRVGKRGLRHTAEALSAGRGLSLLLVGGKVEGDEEDEVRADGNDTGESSKLLARALASIGHPLEVGRGEVGVRGEVDESEIDDELDDLETGNPLLPPNTDTTSALEVVPVHDDVNEEVQDDGDPRDGGGTDELGVAEEGGSTMVVAVEEGQRLLLEEQEDGVKELEVLGEVVEVVQNDKGLGPATLSITNSVEDTTTDNSGQKLLNEESQKSTTDQSQIEVVDQEEALELERLAVAHPLATTEDDAVVDSNEDGCRLDSGHGSLERHKLEVIGGVADNSSESLVEDGPQVNTKGTVDGRQRQLLVKGSGSRRHDGRVN
jgi:hypothetical protein